MEIESLKALSNLLDEALELPPAEREGWLAARSGDQAYLVPTLRELLRRHDDSGVSDWLERGPALSEVSDAQGLHEAAAPAEGATVVPTDCCVSWVAAAWVTYGSPSASTAI